MPELCIKINKVLTIAIYLKAVTTRLCLLGHNMPCYVQATLLIVQLIVVLNPSNHLAHISSCKALTKVQIKSQIRSWSIYRWFTYTLVAWRSQPFSLKWMYEIGLYLVSGIPYSTWPCHWWKPSIWVDLIPNVE